MSKIFIKKIMMPDGSSFHRGECNGCDWIDEHLSRMTVHGLARVHLRVFHNGGVIVHPNYETEVKGR